VTWSNENSKEQPGKVFFHFFIHSFIFFFFKKKKILNNNFQNLLVWEVRTGNLLRSFSSDKKAEQDGWPMFKWSPDDKYLAKMGKGRVEIYQTPDMNLVDKEPLFLFIFILFIFIYFIALYLFEILLILLILVSQLLVLKIFLGPQNKILSHFGHQRLTIIQQE